jgi:hypothetical protein
VAQLFSLGIIHAFMKYTLPLIAFLSLTISSMALDDATVSKQVAGTWIEYSTGYTNTFDYAADGSFRITTRKPSETHSSTGTWQIRDGSMFDRYTNASNVSHPIDITVQYSIVHLDAHQMVRKHEGHTFTLNRP